MTQWKRTLAWLAVTAMTIAALSGCYLLPQEEEVLQPPLLTPVEVEYQTVEVELADIESVITAQGLVVPAKRYDLFFEESGGRISAFPATYGAIVKEGDVLIQLDAEDLEFEMQKQEIYYERNKYNYDKAMKSRNKEVRQSAQWDWDLFEMDYNRMKERLEKSTIKSPIDGQVIYVASANVGDQVGTHSTMVSVADVTQLYVGVSGESATKFTTGMEVELKYNQQVYKGIVVQTPRDKPNKINSAMAEDTTFIQVVDAPDNAIENGARLGAECVVRLVQARRENTIVLSRNLVSSYNGRSYVKVLEDGLKVERDVEIGMANSTQYEILSGLEVGEKVIK